MKPIQPDLKFDERTHTYTWRGRVVPSVTQVLSRVGVITPKQELDKDGNVKTVDEWTPVGFNPNHVNDKKLKEAADFGSAFHKVAAGILEGKTVYYPEKMEPWIGQFRRCQDLQGLDPFCDSDSNIYVECPLYSEKYGYCGTFDMLGSIGVMGCKIYDWKTGTGKESFWPLQLAAYAQLVSECLGFKNICGEVIRFSESGYNIFPVLEKFNEYGLEFQEFNSCLNVYKMVRGE
jgi:hypothetical protein